jgi:hypothetical protein
MVRRKRRSKNHFLKSGAKPYPPLSRASTTVPLSFVEVPLDFFNRMFCSTFFKSGKENNIR